jgi:hypothetical protein
VATDLDSINSSSSEISEELTFTLNISDLPDVQVGDYISVRVEVNGVNSNIIKRFLVTSLAEDAVAGNKAITAKCIETYPEESELEKAVREATCQR